MLKKLALGAVLVTTALAAQTSRTSVWELDSSYISIPDFKPIFFLDFPLTPGTNSTVISLPAKDQAYSFSRCMLRPGNGIAYNLPAPTALSLTGKTATVTHALIAVNDPVPVMRMSCELKASSK
jgi:hypothetical protein